MAFPKRIYLTGFMASGKSTVGLIVANTIGYEFVDLDHLIEQVERRSIPELFRAEGESYFREVEARLLRASSQYTKTVIALGGGTLTNAEAWALLPDDATVVYLETKPSVLARRLFYGRTDRPLMLDDAGNRFSLEEMEARVEELLAARKEYYNRAHITVRSGERPIGRTVDAVVDALRKHG